jgi:hypothetical protein
MGHYKAYLWKTYTGKEVLTTNITNNYTTSKHLLPQAIVHKKDEQAPLTTSHCTQKGLRHRLIDWLVFDAKFNSISAISWREQININLLIKKNTYL